MKATIWHNPNCGTSRNTLAALQARDDVELEVIEYLKNPPSRDKLAQLYRDAGMTPQQGLRLRGTDAEARNLAAASDDEVLGAMAAEPILIERPLVETEKACGCAVRQKRSTKSSDRRDGRLTDALAISRLICQSDPLSASAPDVLAQ